MNQETFKEGLLKGETLKLGENIELNGFSKVDRSTMVILKKVIGNHVKNLFQICAGFEKLVLTMNVPEKIEESSKKSLYELKGVVVDGQKEFSSQSEAVNLFVAVDDVLKNLEKNFQTTKA
ncbi:MAG: hypothetical protein Q8O89_06585 [Nanoarchaeota archaeon]|nr:hypothetical protein [Nanoarchaeota archaeon]